MSANSKGAWFRPRHVPSRRRVAAALFAALAASVAQARDGEIDTAFGTQGYRALAFDLGGSKHDFPADLEVRADGSLVLAGSADVGGQTDVVLTWLAEDGKSEHWRGRWELVGNAASQWARSIAIADDGDILVAGDAHKVVNGSSSTAGFITRFAVAPGVGGFVVDTEKLADGSGIAAVAQWGTHTYTAGWSGAPSPLWEARKYDNAAMGMTLASLVSGRSDKATAIAISPATGDIYVGGVKPKPAPDEDFAIVRINANTGAQTVAEFAIDQAGSHKTDRLAKLAFDSQGRLLVGGTTSRDLTGNRDVFVYRLDPVTLAPDPTFGSSGLVLRDFVPDGDSVLAGVIADDVGRVYVVGTAHLGAADNKSSVAVLRLTAKGAPDALFGQPSAGIGRQFYDLTHSNATTAGIDEAIDVALTPDQKRLLVLSTTAKVVNGVADLDLLALAVRVNTPTYDAASSFQPPSAPAIGIGSTFETLTTVENSGSGPGENVAVRQSFPLNTKVHAATIDGGSCSWSVPLGANKLWVNCTTSLIPAPAPYGGPGKVVLKVRGNLPLSLGAVSTTCTVAGLAMPQCIDTINVVDATAVKTAANQADGMVTPGEVIDYSIIVDGSYSGQVVISDPIPVGTTFVPNSQTGGAPVFNDPNEYLEWIIPAGTADPTVLSFKVKVDANVGTSKIANTHQLFGAAACSAPPCVVLLVDHDADTIPTDTDSCPFDPLNDADGDGVCAADDKCPFNPDPACTTGGGPGDDDDGDGISNGDDLCPQDPDVDCGKPDIDGDGIPDDEDACVLNPNTACQPGDSDGDGTPDDQDACPFDPATGCTGGGGPNDDDDGDGKPNADDPCPQNPDLTCGGPGGGNGGDQDGDGTDDGEDACPLDPLNDFDDDGVCGDVDACPFNPDPACTGGGGADGDEDGDGTPNGTDPCPLVPGLDCIAPGDDDGDGKGNDDDACPLDPQNDVDEDGICGDVDACPSNPDPTCTVGGGPTGDDDGDGIPNGVDACPLNPDTTCNAGNIFKDSFETPK